MLGCFKAKRCTTVELNEHTLYTLEICDNTFRNYQNAKLQRNFTSQQRKT